VGTFLRHIVEHYSMSTCMGVTNSKSSPFFGPPCI